MVTHKYKTKYSFDAEFGEFPKEEIIEQKKGACDAYFFGSFIYPEDGSFSFNWRGMDGRTGENLDMKEVFKMWSMLAIQLSQRLPKGSWQKKVASSVVEITRDIMRHQK